MRHGHCQGLNKGIINGWKDFPLTSKGKKEPVTVAKSITKLLGNVTIDKAYSSYLSRAYDTASIFCSELKSKTKIIQDIRLNERHYGLFQGMSREQAKQYKEYNTLSESYGSLANRLLPEPEWKRIETLNEYSQKLKKTSKKLESIIPNGESILDVEARTNDFMKDILVKENKDKTILIVTHANPVKLIAKELEKLSYKKTSDLRFATCGMKIYDMRYVDGHYEIETEYNINKEWEV